ncbi:hypothetical protein [Streptomyces sp. NPDC056463]|uniref:hypothetical protein n=1 Tax=Streptomyces sp. NPDC056463 TaxID=3345827 RepID=UPI0036BADA3B
MTFEYRDRDADAFTARPTIGTPEPAILLHISPSNSAHVPLDHVEEVVAGIRDAARQAAGQPTQHRIPCGQCGAPWSDGHGQPGDPCSAAGQIATTEQPVVAYRDPNNPRVLLCRQHGQSWHAITPLTAEDLPDGGVCTFGRLSSNECGRDVLAGRAVVEQPAEAQPAEARVRWGVEIRYPHGGTFSLPAVDDRSTAVKYLEAAKATSPEATHDLVRETTTWTVEETR